MPQPNAKTFNGENTVCNVVTSLEWTKEILFIRLYSLGCAALLRSTVQNDVLLSSGKQRGRNFLLQILCIYIHRKYMHASVWETVRARRTNMWIYCVAVWQRCVFCFFVSCIVFRCKMFIKPIMTMITIITIIMMVLKSQKPHFDPATLNKFMLAWNFTVLSSFNSMNTVGKYNLLLFSCDDSWHYPTLGAFVCTRNNNSNKKCAHTKRKKKRKYQQTHLTSFSLWCIHYLSNQPTLLCRYWSWESEDGGINFEIMMSNRK